MPPCLWSEASQFPQLKIVCTTIDKADKTAFLIIQAHIFKPTTLACLWITAAAHNQFYNTIVGYKQHYPMLHQFIWPQMDISPSQLFTMLLFLPETGIFRGNKVSFTPSIYGSSRCYKYHSNSLCQLQLT